MEKNEKILLGAACFFAGITLGFLISPIKKGIGNYSGNYLGDKAILDELRKEAKEQGEEV